LCIDTCEVDIRNIDIQEVGVVCIGNSFLVGESSIKFYSFITHTLQRSRNVESIPVEWRGEALA
jgi:hypothetical protein